MPTSTARQSPIMTLHSAREHAGPSRARASRVGTTTNAAQSLADLYNTRHAQESTASSSSSSSRNASSTSLANLYNKRHDAEERKDGMSSTSLADLYNQRYESEHQDKDDSVEEMRSRHHQVAHSRSKAHAPKGASSTLSAPRTIFRALSIDDSDDEGTPEPKSLLPSESDELDGDDHDDEEEDDINLHSTPIPSGNRDRSQTRSESVANFHDSAELVYVPRSSIPRRGALGSSATRLTMDSDDDLELEMPQASGSSNIVLARPHASPSKLVVHSESASMDPQSGLSTPPIAPHHRKGKSVPQHLLVSTQEEESLTSMLAAESGAESQHAEYERDASMADEPDAFPHDLGSPDEVVVISDSSFDEAPAAYASLAGEEDEAESAASTPEHSLPEEVDAVVLLQSPTKQMRERIGSALSGRASPSLGPPSVTSADMPSELDSGLVSDVDSDVPVITNTRIAELRTGESSGAATESESDAQRSRYPRRARNVTDYNVKRAFERYERTQGQEGAGPVYAPRSKTTLLPIVAAGTEFFDALRSQKGSKPANAAPKPTSFADFLMRKTKAAPAAPATQSGIPPSAHSAAPSVTLTEAQVRTILKPTIGPRPLFDIIVNTQDRAGLFQLEPSTQRWLGRDADSSDDDVVESPPVPGSGTPIPLTFGSIIPLHRRQDKPTPAELRDMFDSLQGTSLIGRPKTATELESASRRLRLGRAYKQHLPDTLRPFADMENQEWMRLEEYLPEVRLRAQEQREREQGRIMVEMDTGDTTRTQYDHFGRKRVSTLRCATGGLLRVFFDTTEADPLVPDDASQGYRLVRTRSHTRSPSLSRLASTPIRHPDSDDSVVDAEMAVEAAVHRVVAPVRQPVAGTVGRVASSAGTPEPITMPEAAKARQQASIVEPPSKTVQPKAVQPPTLQQLFERPTVAEPAPALASKKKATAGAAPSWASSNKPKPAASKGSRDLLSYFSTTQSSPSQPAAKPASASKPATASKAATSSTSKSASAVQRSSAPQATPAVKAATSVQKGKHRALDEDIKVWPISSRSTNSEVEVVIDLTRSSSASESLGTGKRPRSPSPLAVAATSKKKALVNGTKKVVGLVGVAGGSAGREKVASGSGSKAEGKKREVQQQQKAARGRDAMRELDVVPMVDIPALPHSNASSAKRKRPSDAASKSSSHPPKKAAVQLSHVQLPAAPPFTTSTSSASSNKPQTSSKSSSSTHKKSSSANASSGGSSNSTQLPAATPSPTRGGWKGISGWYTNTRDAFSPTPDDLFGKTHREFAKKQRQRKLDRLLGGKGKQKGA
ncbi:uncharacterized protein SRS1_10119 [Sporisorium reilianum f. sp. reilianum]|uniref:Uncharacterized protein n=1 Tax=Sporisorium reilianum f. sp. reilianum TaxID=72559 RepID=A0A2N8U5Z4_9BASI|nr:uncharacterized protein SRS1_10119 [Sporisorium reilianum f. sp. reilianum]